jgi:hypothetical protein
MRLLKNTLVCLVCCGFVVFVFYGVVSYLEHCHYKGLKEAKMAQLESTFWSLEAAFQEYEQSKRDETSDGEAARFKFWASASEHRRELGHVLRHLNDIVPAAPTLLGVRACQYEGINGIIYLIVSYIDEGLSVEGVNVNFRNRTVFLKDPEYFWAAQQHKDFPRPWHEIIIEFDYKRVMQFFLYTEAQEDIIKAFLFPRMRMPDRQGYYVAKISEEEMAEIIQSRVSATLVLSDASHSDAVSLKYAPFRLAVPEHVDFENRDMDVPTSTE